MEKKIGGGEGRDVSEINKEDLASEYTMYSEILHPERFGEKELKGTAKGAEKIQLFARKILPRINAKVNFILEKITGI